MKQPTKKQKRCKHLRIAKQQKIAIFGIVEVNFCLDCLMEVGQSIAPMRHNQSHP